MFNSWCVYLLLNLTAKTYVCDCCNLYINTILQIKLLIRIVLFINIYLTRQENLGTCKLRQDGINSTLTNTMLLQACQTVNKWPVWYNTTEIIKQ